MAEMTEAYNWSGRLVLDADGERVGTIERIYRSPETGQPEWALVHTGLFEGRSAFVPVGSARPSGEDVLISIGRTQIEDAPAIEAERQLSPKQEAALRRHYGGSLSPAIGQGVMTRSEEELQVTKVRRPRTRVRLRKYIVTEMVTTRVPVQHEKVRLEREPITDLDADSFDEPAIGRDPRGRASRGEAGDREARGAHRTGAHAQGDDHRGPSRFRRARTEQIVFSEVIQTASTDHRTG